MECTLHLYVLVQRTELSISTSNPLPTYSKIVIKNTGQSPAVDTRFELDFGIELTVTKPGQPTYVPLKQLNEIVGIIGPDDERVFDVSFGPDEKKSHELGFLATTRFLRLKGTINYIDPVSKSKEETWFYYRWTYGTVNYTVVPGKENGLI